MKYLDCHLYGLDIITVSRLWLSIPIYCLFASYLHVLSDVSIPMPGYMALEYCELYSDLSKPDNRDIFIVKPNPCQCLFIYNNSHISGLKELY